MVTILGMLASSTTALGDNPLSHACEQFANSYQNGSLVHYYGDPNNPLPQPSVWQIRVELRASTSNIAATAKSSWPVALMMPPIPDQNLTCEEGQVKVSRRVSTTESWAYTGGFELSASAEAAVGFFMAEVRKKAGITIVGSATKTDSKTVWTQITAVQTLLPCTAKVYRRYGVSAKYTGSGNYYDVIVHHDPVGGGAEYYALTCGQVNLNGDAVQEQPVVGGFPEGVIVPQDAGWTDLPEPSGCSDCDNDNNDDGTDGNDGDDGGDGNAGGGKYGDPASGGPGSGITGGGGGTLNDDDDILDYRPEPLVPRDSFSGHRPLTRQRPRRRSHSKTRSNRANRRLAVTVAITPLAIGGAIAANVWANPAAPDPMAKPAPPDPRSTPVQQDNPNLPPFVRDAIARGHTVWTKPVEPLGTAADAQRAMDADLARAPQTPIEHTVGPIEYQIREQAPAWIRLVRDTPEYRQHMLRVGPVDRSTSRLVTAFTAELRTAIDAQEKAKSYETLEGLAESMYDTGRVADAVHIWKQLAHSLMQSDPGRSEAASRRIIDAIPGDPGALNAFRLIAMARSGTQTTDGYRGAAEAYEEGMAHFDSSDLIRQVSMHTSYNYLARQAAHYRGLVDDYQQAIDVRNRLLYHPWMPVAPETAHRFFDENSDDYASLGKRSEAIRLLNARAVVFAERVWQTGDIVKIEQRIARLNAFDDDGTFDRREYARQLWAIVDDPQLAMIDDQMIWTLRTLATLEQGVDADRHLAALDRLVTTADRLLDSEHPIDNAADIDSVRSRAFSDLIEQAEDVGGDQLARFYAAKHSN